MEKKGIAVKGRENGGYLVPASASDTARNGCATKSRSGRRETATAKSTITSERFLASFQRRRAAAERTLSATTSSIGMTGEYENRREKRRICPPEGGCYEGVVLPVSRSQIIRGLLFQLRVTFVQHLPYGSFRRAAGGDCIHQLNELRHISIRQNCFDGGE
jgi:hypothetical protein